MAKRLYEGIVDKLPPLPVEDPAYQERVEAAKRQLTHDAVTGEPLEQLPSIFAAEYALRRAKLDLLEKQRYEIEVERKALEQLLITSWEQEQPGWGAYGASDYVLRMEDGSSIEVDPQPIGKIVDSERFLRWCKTPVDRCMVCNSSEDDPRHELSDPTDDLTHQFIAGAGIEHKLTLHSNTANSFAKDHAKAGAAPPPGMSTYCFTKIKFKAAK